jgi:hypothetical protein
MTDHIFWQICEMMDTIDIILEQARNLNPDIIQTIQKTSYLKDKITRLRIEKFYNDFSNG